MHASNGETKGLRVIVNDRRPSWEKVIRKSVMHCHAPPTRWRMVAAADGKSRTWRCVRNWLSPGFLPACRSGDDKPNDGVTGWIWSSRHKSSPENFFFKQ